MSRKIEVDDAIIKALARVREPLRYNELHKKANSIFGERIWIKTFNDHLKKLCKQKKVIRKEKSRYHVTYELEKEYIDVYGRERIDKILEDIKDLMEVPGAPEFFKDIVDDINLKAKQFMKSLEK